MARSPSQWQSLGLKPDRAVMTAIIGLTLVWLVFVVGGMPMKAFYVSHLILTPRMALGPQPWQLLTAGFIHLRLGELFMTVVMLIFFGNPIERQLGARAFWKIFVGGAVAGALGGALLGRVLTPNLPIPISIASTTALLLAFGAAWGSQSTMAYGMMQMRASTMALIFFGITVVSCLVQIEDIGWRAVMTELAALVAAAGAGWVLASRGRGKSGGLGGSLDKMRMWRLKRRYKVLTGGRDSRDDSRWLN